MLKCIYPTPVLNTPDFHLVFGNGINFLRDEQGHIRALEFIALKDTIFQIEELISENICKVSVPFYPKKELFIDIRFTKSFMGEYVKPKYNLKEEQVLEKLYSLVGLPYIWGGNWSRGIPEMLKFYPPKVKLNKEQKELWQLKGVDCSGLLFEASEGFTPRNTSELICFGNTINLEKEMIKPLDLVICKGHVVVVFDKERVIESRENEGVVMNPISVRLKEMQAKGCVIKRWISVI